MTTSGEPVCPFAPPNGKQPFEQVVLACKNSCNYEKLNALNGKIIVSVPSALHSHKPPLEGIFIFSKRAIARVEKPAQYFFTRLPTTIMLQQKHLSRYINH